MMGISFDQWLNEIEVYSTRRERAEADLGPEYERWLLAAWIAIKRRQRRVGLMAEQDHWIEGEG